MSTITDETNFYATTAKIRASSPTADKTIFQYNYWEHFKASKDLARVLPVDHPKRVAIEKAANEILNKINEPEIQTP